MGNQGSIEPIPYEVELNWKKIESNGTPPCPREAHIAVFIAGKLYIYGGGCGSTQYSDLFSLDVAEGSWTEHQVAEGKVAPPKSTGACAAAVGNSIYIFGGLNMEQEWLDELFIFNTETNEWKKPNVNGKAPSRRDKQCCCAVGSKIYFFGGFGPQEPEPEEQSEKTAQSGEAEKQGNEETAEQEEEEEGPCATFGWFDDLFVLDTDTMTWQQQTTHGTPPTARAASALVERNNKLYVFGGRDSTQRQNDLHELDLATMTWNLPRVSGARPIARSFHTLTAVNQHQLVVIGGLSSTNLLLNDVHVYDIESSAWVQPTVRDTNQLTPRRFHSTTLVDQSLFVFGGSCDFDPATNECGKYLNDLYALPIEPILAHGPVKVAEAASGGTEVTSTGLINLTAPFQLSGDNIPTTPFSFEDKGVKRKREQEDDEENEEVEKAEESEKKEEGGN